MAPTMKTTSLEADIPPQFAGIVNRLIAEGLSKVGTHNSADLGPTRTQQPGNAPEGDNESGSDFSSPRFRGSPSGENVPQTFLFSTGWQLLSLRARTVLMRWNRRSIPLAST